MDKYLRYKTEVAIAKGESDQINKEFALCDVLVCYHGDNRNETSISKQSIENALGTAYGIPIVGEWVKEERDQNKETWGSHGGRIIVDSEGIKFEQTTKPFGFVTKDAVENASWVEVLEKDGHTKHEYLKLPGCVLWTARYAECESILEANYGQSMEIAIEQGGRREDGIFDIKAFTFSALCILGDEHPPCFESATIGRHYALDDFKKEVTEMLDAYRRFESAAQNEGGETVKNRILDVLRGFTFKSPLEEDIAQYALLSYRDGEVDVLDRTDYKAYTIAYEVGEEETVVFNLDGKTERAIGAVDVTEDALNLFVEIESASKACGAVVVAEQQNHVIKELNAAVEELQAKFDAQSADLESTKTQLEAYVKAEAIAKEEAHRAEVDAEVNKYSAELAHCSEYHVYRANIDYTKSVDAVHVDMVMLAGNYALTNGKTKAAGFGVDTYSFKPQKNTDSDPYGGLLDAVCED